MLVLKGDHKDQHAIIVKASTNGWFTLKLEADESTEFTLRGKDTIKAAPAAAAAAATSDAVTNNDAEGQKPASSDAKEVANDDAQLASAPAEADESEGAKVDEGTEAPSTPSKAKRADGTVRGAAATDASPQTEGAGGGRRKAQIATAEPLDISDLVTTPVALKKGADVEDLSKLSVDELKERAVEAGIKIEGKGWKKSCPPNGLKADILRKLEEHVANWAAMTPSRTAPADAEESEDAKIDEGTEASSTPPAKPEAKRANGTAGGAAATDASPQTKDAEGGRRKERLVSAEAPVKTLFGDMPLPCQDLYNGEHKKAVERKFSGPLFRRDVPLLDDVHQGDVSAMHITCTHVPCTHVMNVQQGNVGAMACLSAPDHALPHRVCLCCAVLRLPVGRLVTATSQQPSLFSPPSTSLLSPQRLKR